MDIISATTPHVSTNNKIPLSYYISTFRDQLRELYNNRNIIVSRLPDDAVRILYYAAINNARISEILNIKNSDYLGNSRYYIKALKGGKSYVGLLTGQESDNRASCPVTACDRVFAYSYSRIYRWCVIAGFRSVESGRKNCSCTHRHRTVIAGKVWDHGKNIAVTSVLHHSSFRTAIIYTRKKE